MVEMEERRSMVGAPPTSAVRRSSMLGTPPTSRPMRNAPRSAAKLGTAKRKTRDEESEEDSDKEKEEKESEDSDDGEEEEVQGPSKPKRKKRRNLLTDSAAKSKRKAAKKALEPEVAPVDEDEEEEVKSPTPVEPEPVMKAASVTRYSPFQLMCDHILRKIMYKDPEEYFAFPVTASMAPDYHTIIQHPMDFSKMRQKIEDNTYNTIPEMRQDAELIVTNALSYNNPHTVYHLAATRLSAITRYYFSEQYLRYIFHTLPFANQVPMEKAGILPMNAVYQRAENRRRQALIDDLKAEDCLKMADASVRPRLATRLPSEAKLAFIDNKDGATVLNVIGETGKKGIKLTDIVGPLEEGTPGMLSLGDHSLPKLSGQAPVSYLNYGAFCSFAPQYDSTWATLTKRDSDLLLRTYGDRNTVADVLSLRDMVSNAGDHFIKVVDDLLDSMTDGEHSRTMDDFQKRGIKEEPISMDNVDLESLLTEVESLENLGVDMSFVQDIRQMYGIHKAGDVQAQLDATGRAVLDLARVQNQRLGQAPPITLSKAAPPGAIETQLAGNVQQQLVTQVSQYAPPGQMVSSPAIHNAIGIQQNNEDYMDILGEFFVT